MHMREVQSEAYKSSQFQSQYTYQYPIESEYTIYLFKKNKTIQNPLTQNNLYLQYKSNKNMMILLFLITIMMK